MSGIRVFRRRDSQSIESPYASFLLEEMILRDHLAMDRTSLANERTLLSYVRTALACILGGASAAHLLPGLFIDIVGGGLIAFGVLALAFGLSRYRWYRRRIDAVRAHSTLTAAPLDGYGGDSASAKSLD